MSERVTIFDTTLRDGEQAPGFSLKVNEKLQLARQLDALGVDVIEAGFPIASEADAEAVRAVSAEVRRPIVAALARCRRDDIDRAGHSLSGAARPRIHTFIATSDLHLTRKLHITREACLEAAVAAVRQARQYTDNVQFSAEDATRSDLDFLCRVVEAVIEAGATTVNLPDTVGYATPKAYGEIFSHLLAKFPQLKQRGIILSSHCHNDLGLAVANSLAAVQNGARQPINWLLRIRWQRFRTERARSRERSMASANAPETPRSRRSSWRCRFAPTHCPIARRSRPRRWCRRATRCHRSLAFRCRPTRRSSAQMRSLMKRASIRTAC